MIGSTKRWSSPAGMLLLITWMICICLGPGGCTIKYAKDKTRATQFKFNFEDKDYRIRCIFSDCDSLRRNELIAEDFLAVDLDQDRIIDQVVMGQTSLAIAQYVYTAGLKELELRGNLKVVDYKFPVFKHHGNSTIYEIKTFLPADAHPFNQFKLIRSYGALFPDITVILDRNADGILDEILEGTGNNQEFQGSYTSILETGVKTSKIILEQNIYLVKSKVSD